MKKAVGFYAALVLAFSALAEPGGSSLVDQPVVIDVRTADEYRSGHVREAVNVPYDEIAGRIAALAPDRNTRIVLYCRSGRRSAVAEQTLRQLGYQRIENQGGLEDMLRGGYRAE